MRGGGGWLTVDNCAHATIRAACRNRACHHHHIHTPSLAVAPCLAILIQTGEYKAELAADNGISLVELADYLPLNAAWKQRMSNITTSPGFEAPKGNHMPRQAREEEQPREVSAKVTRGHVRCSVAQL